MLNRLYIWLGVTLIIIISGAFIAPRFFDWSGTRPRMEQIASEALGAAVKIQGDIDFVLLPQPRLKFGKVVVGPAGAPFVEVASAQADFSLMDFLRDRFIVTRLVLQAPQLNLTIDEGGAFQLPIHLPQTVSTSNVSIADASIEAGTLQLEDKRSGETWRMQDVSGSLKLSALRGPFGFNASGNYEGQPYLVRVSTSPMNAEGAMQVAAFLRPASDDFSLNAEGVLQTGVVPSFTGKASVRQKPKLSDDIDDVRGDLVFNAEFDANSERIRLANYTLLPDENRAGTRLSGAVIVHLGAERYFEAVVSGGVVALTARDARAETGGEPYEFLRLLNELPTPIIPPFAGKIGMDIAELDLRAFSMRNVRLDASVDDQAWHIENFSANLSGDTALSLSGTVSIEANRPAFDGEMSMETDRLDAVAQLWRHPAENNPLFGVSASLSSKVGLVGNSLSLQEGELVFDGVSNTFATTLMIDGGSLDVHAALGELDAFQSRALAALLPDISTGNRFAASFEQASFDVSAEAASIFDLDGRKLSARGDWQPDGWRLSNLSAGELGGAGFTVSGELLGPLNDPQISGKGRVILNVAAADGALPMMMDFIGAAPQVRDLADRSLPASVEVNLDAPTDAGDQSLSASGQFGAGDAQLAVHFSNGLPHYLTAPMDAQFEISADNPDDLLAQLGVPVTLDGEGPAVFRARAQGSALNSMDVELSYDSPDDKLSYAGNAIVSDLGTLRGRGNVRFDLSNPTYWGEWLGAADIYVPALTGVAEVNVAGVDAIALTGINGRAGSVSFTGELSRIEEIGVPIFGGDLVLSDVKIDGMLSTLGGGAALASLEGGVWPDGPFVISPMKRTSRGRVRVAAPQMSFAGKILANDPSFSLTWNPQSLRIGGLEAKTGGGDISLDLSICCSGVQADRQITARGNVAGVEIGALLPKIPSERLGGKITGSFRLEGTGENLTSMIDTATGEGSFTLANLVIDGFDPKAFLAAAEAENILELNAEQLTEIVAAALAEGHFAAPEMSGVFTIAGGTLRSANLAATREDARLFGGLSVDFLNLDLGGSWTLAPIGDVGDTGLINETTARITAILGGTLIDPSYELDLAQMVDGIKVRAFELEVDRLEKLKAEQEARAKAAAEERARLMAEEARRLLEEELAKAEAEKAAEAERLRLLQIEQEKQSQEALDLLLQDLGVSQDPLLPQPPLDGGAIQLLPGETPPSGASVPN